MVNYKKIGLYTLVNILGFSSMSINFLIAVQLGVFENRQEDTVLVLRDVFFNNTTSIWMVCAIFSLAYFFVEKPANYVFLASAFVVPFLYGFTVLFTG